MKYSPALYAQALSETLDASDKNKHAAILGRFAAIIHKHGDMAHAENILNALCANLIKKAGGRMVQIEFARPQSSETAKNLKKYFLPTDVISTHINPELVAGIRVTIDNEMQYDGSLIRKLNKLFA